MRSAPPRKDHKEKEIEVNHDPILDQIPTIPDAKSPKASKKIENSAPKTLNLPIEEKHSDKVSDWDEKSHKE